MYPFGFAAARRVLEKAWHEDIESDAAAFTGWMAMRWPYADLECP